MRRPEILKRVPIKSPLRGSEGSIFKNVQILRKMVQNFRAFWPRAAHSTPNHGGVRGGLPHRKGTVTVFGPPEPLGLNLSHLSIFGRFAAIFGHFDSILVHFDSILEPFWHFPGISGAFWAIWAFLSFCGIF